MKLKKVNTNRFFINDNSESIEDFAADAEFELTIKEIGDNMETRLKLMDERDF
jgi:hypothetical protein